MHRLLPVVVIFILVASFFYLPLKRQIVYSVQNQIFQGKIQLADDYPSCVNTLNLTDTSGKFDDSASIAFYNSEEVDYPKTSLAEINDQNLNQNVLSAYDSAGKEKWIEVDLKNQLLTAWEGSDKMRQFPISSGLFYPTPPGTYSIYWKTRYIRMVGGSSELGTFYDLPNVPDTMFFYQGYALHGAYWHNNFGHPMSHGCVNEPLDQAHWLFEWSGPNIPPDQSSIRASAENPGSRVYIH